jgi:two-component system chemotaxis response regulator CheB
LLYESASGELRLKSAEVPAAFGAANQTRTPSLAVSNVAAQAGENRAKSGPIRVMIVDDSVVIQKIFERVFRSDSRFEIAGIAPDPMEADQQLSSNTIDLMILDLHMPKMDGLTYLAKLMRQPKFPILVVSGIGNENSEAALRATELGAVDFVAKPSGSALAEFSETLIEKALSAASVNLSKVGMHLEVSGTGPSRSGSNCELGINESIPILIGSSTGGTVALTELLTAMPANIPPIAIVQHIPPHFSMLFARRLNQLCSFEVREAQDGDQLQKGLCLIAPGDTQMRFDGKGLIRIVDEPPVNRHKPSVDVLFHSGAKFLGKQAIGVILTGMGKDGAKGLLAMREAGCHTIGQDEASCVVYGMPKEAFEIGAVAEVLPLQDIASRLVHHLKLRKAS